MLAYPGLGVRLAVAVVQMTAYFLLHASIEAWWASRTSPDSGASTPPPLPA